MYESFQKQNAEFYWTQEESWTYAVTKPRFLALSGCIKQHDWLALWIRKKWHKAPSEPDPLGWSELAATNAPVADEPVEAVSGWTKIPSSLPEFYLFFFHLFSTPNFFPVLPNTYLPPPTYHLPTPPPSLHRQSSCLQRRWAGVSLELGAAWSGNELGAWNELGAGTSLERERAWSLELGMSLQLGVAGARPTQDPGKHFLKITMLIFFYPGKRFAATQAPELACYIARACCNVATSSKLRSFSRACLLCCSKLQAPELLRSFLALKRNSTPSSELRTPNSELLRTPNLELHCSATPRNPKPETVLEQLIATTLGAALQRSKLR
jgi:hypothetical protein